MLNFIFSFLIFAHAATNDGIFRFHLFSEPHTLDPQTSAAASGNYLFNNLYRGLFHYTNKGGLKLDGAKECKRSKLQMRCVLKKHKWSNGQDITAENYIQAFRRLIDPDMKSPQSDVLFTLKNAREIWQGKMPPDQLGISSPSPDILIFHFAEDDPEFEYRLIHPALTPLPPGGFLKPEEGSKMPVNGPYRIKEWKKGAWIKLVPNPHFEDGFPGRPDLEALFIEDDSTALRLYESGTLTFLRRLVASEFPRFQNSPEFSQVPMARFDYVGFGPALLAHPKLRESLVNAAEFQDFMSLFGARSPAGCPSLPATYLDKVKCLEFNPKRAKSLLKEAGRPPKMEMQFSRMGGDDIARAAEWFQGQWKKNLGLTITLNGQEQGTYLRILKTKPPMIFRKGVSLDRPTCAAALEIFSKGHPDNYIALDDPKFEKLLKKVSSAGPGKAKRKACSAAVNYLMSLNRLIPLGEMHFTVLAKKQFTGWTLNELNQLDLSQLRKAD